jgi:chemotaxis methyl-accepting protein methylase
MLLVGATTFAQYRRLLEEDRGETARLLERLTIKVSSFYRNPSTFGILRHRVIPELRARVRPLVVWSAGCGCGEEAYTLAMLLEEAGVAGRVLATDLDESALGKARVGEYGSSTLEHLPEELRARYLEELPTGRFRVRNSLRNRVRFSRGDLSQATPASTAAGFELVLCRNVLIYWEREVQRAILNRLIETVAPGGYLCLGEAEWPLPGADAGLRAIHAAERVFRRGTSSCHPEAHHA